MGNTNRAVRLVGPIAAALLAVTLTGCGPGDTSPGTTVSPAAPPTTSSPTTPAQETDVRTRLAAGLRDSSPIQAQLVERPETTLKESATPWLAGWQIIDVLNSTPPHPRRFFVALSADGTAKSLTGQPESFSAVTTAAGVDAGSAKVAESVATLFLDSTQDFLKASYRVSAVDDIQWLPKLNAAKEKQKAEVEKQFGDQIAPATAKKSDDGWTVTVWMVYGRRLDRHTVTLTSAGAVSDQVVHAYETLPVPDSM